MRPPLHVLCGGPYSGETRPTSRLKELGVKLCAGYRWTPDICTGASGAEAVVWLWGELERGDAIAAGWPLQLREVASVGKTRTR